MDTELKFGIKIYILQKFTFFKFWEKSYLWIIFLYLNQFEPNHF
jgi:hypothetical protein